MATQSALASGCDYDYSDTYWVSEEFYSQIGYWTAYLGSHLEVCTTQPSSDRYVHHFRISGCVAGRGSDNTNEGDPVGAVDNMWVSLAESSAEGVKDAEFNLGDSFRGAAPEHDASAGSGSPDDDGLRPARDSIADETDPESMYWFDREWEYGANDGTSAVYWYYPGSDKPSDHGHQIEFHVETAYDADFEIVQKLETPSGDLHLTWRINSYGHTKYVYSGQ